MDKYYVAFFYRSTRSCMSMHFNDLRDYVDIEIPAGKKISAKMFEREVKKSVKGATDIEIIAWSKY